MTSLLRQQREFRRPASQPACKPSSLRTSQAPSATRPIRTQQPYRPVIVQFEFRRSSIETTRRIGRRRLLFRKSNVCSLMTPVALSLHRPDVQRCSARWPVALAVSCVRYDLCYISKAACQLAQSAAGGGIWWHVQAVASGPPVGFSCVCFRRLGARLMTQLLCRLFGSCVPRYRTRVNAGVGPSPLPKLVGAIDLLQLYRRLECGLE